jgi:hypothetical protein
MGSRLTQLFTQTDPLQADIGSPDPSAYIYGNNNPVVYTDPSGLRAVHTKNPQPIDIPAGSARAQFPIPKWPGYGVSRMQFFINDNEVCLGVGGYPKTSKNCGKGDNRGIASGAAIGDYNLGARVRVVFDHERGLASVIAYPTHQTDGSEKAALDVIYIPKARYPIPPSFPSSVRGLGGDSDEFSFDYNFVNSNAARLEPGPAIYGRHRVSKAGGGNVQFEGCLGQYPSFELIRDRSDGSGGYSSNLIYSRKQASGSPKALLAPCSNYGATG